jgi:glutamate-1-semialdehyde 2,1-aminomutase
LHASLASVITQANYERMERGAAQLATGLALALRSHRVDWQVSQVGARVECARAPAPRSGRESLAAIDHELEAALHLYLLNRGFLLTPFHNMMLVSPVTTGQQIGALLAAFDLALAELAPFMRAA